MTWIAIRADANVEIGTGHVMRCISIAEAFQKRGLKAHLFYADLTESLQTLLARKEITSTRLNIVGTPNITSDRHRVLPCIERDAELFLIAMHAVATVQGPPKLIVSDHYQLDTIWETIIKSASDASILVIDDLADRHHNCDFLLDATFGRIPADYQSLTPNDCKLLLGPDYALLRGEFLRNRTHCLEQRQARVENGLQPKKLLISMGGADAENITQKILHAIAALPQDPGFETNVLVGGAYPHLETLRQEIEHFPYLVRLHHDVTNVPELIAQMDLCIGAAGTSTWERCCLGLPAVHVILAANQREIAETLDQNGIAINVGWHEELDPTDLIANQCMPLLQQSDLLVKYVTACQTICDGQGTARFFRELAFHNKTRTFAMREASSADSDLILDWQHHPQTRRYSNNRAIPEERAHYEWMENKLADDQVFFYLLTFNDYPAGVVRLEPYTETEFEDALEISILTAPEFYGLGVATKALDLLRDRHPNNPLVAQVYAENTISRRLFSNAGFRMFKSDYFVTQANFEGDD